MKILMFNTFYSPNQVGGAEKSVQFLAEGLVKNGYQVVVVCTSNRDYQDTINGVKVCYVNAKNLYWVYHSKKQLTYKKPLWHLIDSYNVFIKNKIERLIKDENPDVVHTHNLSGFSDIIWGIAKKCNKKVVHTIRDYYQICPDSTMYKSEAKFDYQSFIDSLYAYPKKIMSNKVDAVVGVSKFILNKHLSYGYFKNAKTKTSIFNPVPVPNKCEKSKSKFIRIGLIGLISRNKGSEYVLERFSKLGLSNGELHLFGRFETEEYGEYLQEKYSAENIIYHGFKKVDEIYTNIDILIVSSLWNEPFPRTFIESMSYKTPVLSTNRGGTKEMMHVGKNGYIFDPNVEGDFEEKLDLTIDLFNRGTFEFDLNAFSFQTILDKYIKVYKAN